MSSMVRLWRSTTELSAVIVVPNSDMFTLPVPMGDVEADDGELVDENGGDTDVNDDDDDACCCLLFGFNARPSRVASAEM